MSENPPIHTSAGAAVTAIAAVVYGLGVAFLDLGPTANQWWLMVVGGHEKLTSDGHGCDRWRS